MFRLWSLGRVMVATGLLLAMIAFLAVPVTVNGTGDLARSLAKQATALSQEVTTAQAQLSSPMKPECFGASPEHMQEAVSSLSQTATEAAKMCQGCASSKRLKDMADKLAKSVQSVAQAQERVRQQRKSAQKTLGKMSAILRRMKKEARTLAKELSEPAKPGAKKLRPGRSSPRKIR